MGRPRGPTVEVLPPEREHVTGSEVVPVTPRTPIRQVKQVQVTFSTERKQVFLDGMEKRGDKFLAAAEAGVHVRTVYDHIRKDPEFRRLYEEAYDSFKSSLEEYALQRARVSDRVLELVLKRHIPKYRERVQVDQRTQVLPHPDRVEVDKLTPDQRDALRLLLGVEPASARTRKPGNVVPETPDRAENTRRPASRWFDLFGRTCEPGDISGSRD